MKHSIQKTVTFISHHFKRESFTDNLKAWFKLSVIDSALMGTPRERPIRHTLEVTITDYLLDYWGLPGATEPSVVGEEMVKVAFQVAEEHITALLREGTLMDEALPPALLSTANTSKTFPYKLSNIAYPDKSTFTVEIEVKAMVEQDIHSAETDKHEGPWHKGEMIDYGATSGSIIRVADDRFIQAREISWSELPQSSSLVNSVWLLTFC